jgi:predicted NAD/FAD-binding protein
VQAVRRGPNSVAVTTEGGHTEDFDHVLIATHADEALALLKDADPMERRLLGAWRYTTNTAVLHRDPALMPKRRRVWSSWNVVGGTGPDKDRLCVTYWMNRLQSLETSDNLFVTLNPVRPPAPTSVIGRYTYTHPVFDAEALLSQDALWTLQGHRRSWYCGSYFGYGFHEDALQSGLAAAEALGGVRRPWTVPGENDRLPLSRDARRDAA